VNLRLTDYLTCPSCRSGSGLILLADRVNGRRIEQGVLGCPQCRARFSIVDGVADFDNSNGHEERVENAQAVQVAALLGVTEGPALVLLVGGYHGMAGEVADLLQDVEVVVAGATVAPARHDGVSVLRVAHDIPLRDGSMRGVMVANGARHLLQEAARVCALAGRVVVQAPGPHERANLLELGMHVVLEQNETLIAVRES
jgi:uncharacterized protein YbaR (Trm112 family)